ncbi:hypothetical protein OG349_07850 [Streptomyces sp. NBC_01317]|nr:hypothetical protein OG349_07850 [Streptomyces sp. NBC_01317]
MTSREHEPRLFTSGTGDFLDTLLGRRHAGPPEFTTVKPRSRT